MIGWTFRSFFFSEWLESKRGWDLRYYPAGGDKEVSRWIENPSGQQEYKHSPHRFKHYKMKNRYKSSKTMTN